MRVRRLALAIAALISCVGTAAPVDSDHRLAVPDPQARAKSAKLIAELFQADLARIRSTDQEAAYARKLLDSAADTADDPAGRFELFEEARGAAAHAGDGETAMRAVSQISSGYRADGLSLAAQTLCVVVPTPARTTRRGRCRSLRGSLNCWPIIASSTIAPSIPKPRYRGSENPL